MARTRALVGVVVVVSMLAGCSRDEGGGNGGVSHTLAVTISGAGAGTVTSSPPGISCSSGTCSASFAEGAVVALTATPSGGSTLESWAGACSGEATAACTLTIGGDASVTATFHPPPVMRTLSVTIAGSGSGTVTSSPSGISCSTGTQTATFADGEVVILDAAPAGPGSAFVGWAGACSGEPWMTCIASLVSKSFDDEG